MADNVTITQGSGTTVATDDIGGVHYQKVKLAYGAADSATLVDSSNPLPVSTLHNITGISDGRKTVTTAGTAEALAGSTACKEVTIQALLANTDSIVVGGSSVVASSGTRRGIALLPGFSITIKCDNLSDIYVDSVVDGEGVSYIYLT